MEQIVRFHRAVNGAVNEASPLERLGSPADIRTVDLL